MGQRLILRLRGLDRTLLLDAADWGVSALVARVLLILPILAVIALGLVAPHPRLYHFLIDEDHVIEWLQFAVIFAGGVAFTVAGWRAFRVGRRGLATLFALVAISSLVVAGEEISWGQRVFGLITPDALKDINHQGETNVHNISIVQRLFNLGEMLAGLYGFGVPILLAALSLRGRQLASFDRLLVPPLCLATVFLLPFGYRAFRAFFLPEAGERITEFGELPELTLYLGILVCGIVISRALVRATPGAAPA